MVSKTITRVRAVQPIVFFKFVPVERIVPNAYESPGILLFDLVAPVERIT